MHTMKHHRSLFFAAVSLFCTLFAYAGDVTFDPNTRYSELIINACIGNFSGNTTETGFNTFNEDGTSKATATHSKKSIDYVPGLVAKAVIEAVDYYQDQSFAKPWFYSVEWYGNKFYDGIETEGGSLDNLNAVKLYFLLGELAASGKFAAANANTVSNCATAKAKALQGLQAHNTKYSITATSGSTNPNEKTPISNAAALPMGSETYDVTGGWWHKSGYHNQLWLDGQYMGPALLAQYVAAGQNITGTTEGDWNLIVKQFDIVWHYCWNATDKLLYHAFCADGGTNGTSYSTHWEGLSNTTGKECYHSAEYWGRAEGWYVLALVDVLEQMDKAGLPKSDARYTRLLGYLQQAMDGLLARQDETTGCWYQLLGHKGDFSVNNYYRKDGTTLIKAGPATNYLESSATAIFTDVLLKGKRLGYLTDSKYEAAAKKAYKGLVEQFVKTDVDGNPYGIVRCCRSAGLGGKKEGEDMRTGSAAYYLLGSDVTATKENEYTEGKALGAFILAAVEYERAYLPVAAAGDDPSGCKCLKVSLQ